MASKEFHKFITQLAQESAKFILPYYLQSELKVESKNDKSPVTIADRGAEQLMREMIAKNYPTHGIIGEEFGRENENAEFVWVMDPIDGTQTFIRGCPLFGSLICLMQGGVPILGVINLPALSQFCIGDGQATYINGKQVKVSSANDLKSATLLVTDPKMVSQFQNAKGFEALVSQAGFMRTWGDCYGYFSLAAGYADIMLDPIMNPWDILAVIPVIEGAGGKITSWQGGGAVTANSCVAASKHLHCEVVKILAGN